MIEEVNDNLEIYFSNWSELVSARENKLFFGNLKPVAVGWKVADKEDYKKFYNEVHGLCDKIIETWMNGRWIAELHLKDSRMPGRIEIIKLMGRRPGSDDALGLDHVDFYSPDSNIRQVLSSEPNLEWSEESNDAVENYHWQSIWFAGTEAKIKNGTVFETITQELGNLNRKIIG